MTVVDPVCKMEVETDMAQWKSEYKGQTYYFCSPGCKCPVTVAGRDAPGHSQLALSGKVHLSELTGYKRSFDKEPDKYLQGGPSAAMGPLHEPHP